MNADGHCRPREWMSLIWFGLFDFFGGLWPLAAARGSAKEREQQHQIKESGFIPAERGQLHCFLLLFFIQSIGKVDWKKKKRKENNWRRMGGCNQRNQSINQSNFFWLNWFDLIYLSCFAARASNPPTNEFNFFSISSALRRNERNEWICGGLAPLSPIKSFNFFNFIPTINKFH